MVFDFSAIRVPRQKHYSDSTLMTWNKKELIGYIRMLEHNYDVSIQFNENQAQYIGSFCPFFKADRKTENCSEKPNNCKDKPQHGYMWTCSKCGLEVHSDYGKCPRCGELKDEPQTERSE